MQNIILLGLILIIGYDFPLICRTDTIGVTFNYSLTTEQISELKEANQSDTLNGSSSMSSFDENLAKALSKRNADSLSIDKKAERLDDPAQIAYSSVTDKKSFNQPVIKLPWIHSAASTNNDQYGQTAPILVHHVDQDDFGDSRIPSTFTHMHPAFPSFQSNVIRSGSLNNPHLPTEKLQQNTNQMIDFEHTPQQPSLPRLNHVFNYNAIPNAGFPFPAVPDQYPYNEPSIHTKPSLPHPKSAQFEVKEPNEMESLFSTTKDSEKDTIGVDKNAGEPTKWSFISQDPQIKQIVFPMSQSLNAADKPVALSPSLEKDNINEAFLFNNGAIDVGKSEHHATPLTLENRMVAASSDGTSSNSEAQRFSKLDNTQQKSRFIPTTTTIEQPHDTDKELNYNFNKHYNVEMPPSMKDHHEPSIDDQYISKKTSDPIIREEGSKPLRPFDDVGSQLSDPSQHDQMAVYRINPLKDHENQVAEQQRSTTQLTVDRKGAAEQSGIVSSVNSAFSDYDYERCEYGDEGAPIFADKRNPAMYITCSSYGTPVRLPCPTSTHFNDDMKTCVPEGFVDSSCGSNCANGECVLNAKLGQYVCSCNVGYTGQNCTQKVDYCKDFGFKCGSGKCINQVGTYVCDCGNGLIGHSCNDANQVPCSTQFVSEGGRLDRRTYHPFGTDHTAYVTCFTKDSFVVRRCKEGQYWDQSSLACVSHKPRDAKPGCEQYPCLFGGQCVSVENISDHQQSDEDRYRCICAPGYFGRNCEFVIDHCKPNPCSGHPCVSTSNPPGYYCECPNNVYDDCCCNDIENRCDSKARGGFYAEKEGMFVHCTPDGRAFVKHCPPGFWFDESKLTCVKYYKIRGNVGGAYRYQQPPLEQRRRRQMSERNDPLSKEQDDKLSAEYTDNHIDDLNPIFIQSSSEFINKSKTDVLNVTKT